MKATKKTSFPRDMIFSEDTLHLLFSLVTNELLKDDQIFEKLHSTMCLPSSFFERYKRLGVALDELEIYKRYLSKYDTRTKK